MTSSRHSGLWNRHPDRFTWRETSVFLSTHSLYLKLVLVTLLQYHRLCCGEYSTLGRTPRWHSYPICQNSPLLVWSGFFGELKLAYAVVSNIYLDRCGCEWCIDTFLCYFDLQFAFWDIRANMNTMKRLCSEYMLQNLIWWFDVVQNLLIFYSQYCEFIVPKNLLILHSPSHFLFLFFFKSMSLKHTPAICGVTKGFEHKAKYAFLCFLYILIYLYIILFLNNDCEWCPSCVRHNADPPSTLVASTPDGRAHYSRRLLNVRDLFGPVVWRKNNWVVFQRTASDDQIGSRVTFVFVFYCLIIFAPNSLL